MFRPWREHAVARNVVSRSLTMLLLQSEPALRLLQRTDKQEEQAQQYQQEVDDLAAQVFLVEE